MRAMVVPRFGGPEVFEPAELPEPEPGPGQVSISVEFIGVNFTDVRNRRGDGMGVPPMVVGVEVAGHIRRLGEGATGLEPGQAVTAGTGGHAYAEVVIADAGRVFPLPDSLVGDPVSATLSVVVPVSLLLLRQAARALPHESMLVHGASGGVGTALAQVAGVLGLGPVYGTVSTQAKADYASGFPFAGVFLRNGFVEGVKEATGGRGVDAVFDPIGGEARTRSFEVLAPFGRLVHFGNASLEPEVAPDAMEMRSRAIGYIGYSAAQHFSRDPEGTRPVFAEAIDLVASGRVRIDVTEVLRLDQAAEAHARIEAGEAMGKLVLAVGS